MLITPDISSVFVLLFSFTILYFWYPFYRKSLQTWVLCVRLFISTMTCPYIIFYSKIIMSINLTFSRKKSDLKYVCRTNAQSPVMMNRKPHFQLKFLRWSNTDTSVFLNVATGVYSAAKQQK